jgi:hypothetical protein
MNYKEEDQEKWWMEIEDIDKTVKIYEKTLAKCRASLEKYRIREENNTHLLKHSREEHEWRKVETADTIFFLEAQLLILKEEKAEFIRKNELLGSLING